MAGSAYSSLKQLGKKTRQPRRPEEAKLERVRNPHPGTVYLVRFTAPEFTSLCPVTGQPDFAHFVIDYVPDRWIVESKSLKLFLGSCRHRVRISGEMGQRGRQRDMHGSPVQVSPERGQSPATVGRRRYRVCLVFADGPHLGPLRGWSTKATGWQRWTHVQTRFQAANQLTVGP